MRVQTEIGLLPEDWKVVRLEDEFKTFSTASFSRDQMSDVGEVCCVHYGDIHTKYGNVVNAVIDEIPHISIAQAARYKNLKDGDLLLADASEDDEGIGKPIAILCHGKKVIAGLHIIPLRKKDENMWHVTFPSYLFSGRMVKGQIERLSEGTKVNSITYNKIKDVLIPLPPKPEQERIAAALTSIDSLIANLERTIQKKKHIREGAMEELLSGKRRLPGFSGEWVEKKFDEMFRTVSTRGKGIDTKEYLPIGKFPIIDQGQEDIVGYTYKENPIRVKDGGFIVFGDHTRIFKFIQYDFFVGADGTKVLSCNEGNSPMFLYFLCLKLNIPNTGYNRHFVYLRESVFYLPSDIHEQHAIADTLTALDDEIALLQAERDKYQQIRSGMMDDLLTGKIRLQ